ncbi:MAG: hypothetical protein AB1Z98_09780 [Nannocystaceae bacterium]
MNYPCSSWLPVACAALCCSLLGGCGDDGGAGDTSQATAGSSTGATGSTTSADTDPTSAGTLDGGSTTTAPTDPTAGTTEAETEGGSTTETETGGSVCDGLDAEQCLANMECMPISGRPIVDEGAGACLAEREYIECQPATGCGDAITYACEGDDAPLYEFPDTCTPVGWVDCGEPPPDLEPCPV